MPNTQTGPYPVLFAKNTTSARINLQTRLGGTHFRRSLGPGETKEVPWVIAKSAGFHRLWLDGKLEVSDKFDFSTTLDELPSIGVDDGPDQWGDIEGVPEEFPPTEHTHAITEITGLQTELNGKAPSTHTHNTAQVTGLDTALAGKAASSHVHTWDQINDKPATFAPTIGSTASTAVAGDDPRLSDERTPKTHTHAISQVTGLQGALDGKAATGHTHNTGQVTGLDTALAAKAPVASPTFTGTPSAPTATAGTNTTQLATTAFVTAGLGTKADTTHTHAWADITGKPTIPDEAPVAAAQADSTATDVTELVADFNSLLAKLRAAGIIEES